MVQRLSEIFSDRPGDTNLAEHRIDLTSDVPVRQAPHPAPFTLQPSLKKELQQMEDLGQERFTIRIACGRGEEEGRE